MRPHTKMIVLMCTLIFGILFLREEDCSTTLAKLNDDYDKREKAILEKGVKTLNSYLKDLPDESNEGKRGEPKHEEPKHEDPKHEEPKHEEPKHEEPKHEEPKHEEPKHEEPKHEEPKHEEPKHEEPKHEEQVESSIPGVTLAAEKKFDADMRQKWKASAGLYKDKSRHRELENVVMVTMVNNAYEKMFNNWKCQADKFGLDFLVLAFDSKAISFMGDDKTVVLPGSDTEEQIRVNTNRFNVMGCQKVDAVIKLLEIGADVIVIDADCVFKKEPVKFFKEAMQHDFYFQSNHPDCRTLDSANPDPACFLINSGFYYVTGKNKAMIELLKKARKSCYEHADVKNVSPTDGAGDQRALQRMLNNELNIPTHYYGAWDSHLKTVPAPWRQAYALNTSSLFKSASFCTHEHDQRLPKPVFHYCTLDPTIYPAGKHKGIVHDEMVAFHANHLPGGIEAKIRQLTKHRLWNGGEKCAKMVTGDSCNRNNYLSRKPSTKVAAAPGGDSSLSLGWDQVCFQQQKRKDTQPAEVPRKRVTPPPQQVVAEPPPAAVVPQEKQQRQQQLQQQQQQEQQQSPPRAGQSSNAWASNNSQNCGNMITDRPSTRVHAPPGGKSSISF